MKKTTLMIILAAVVLISCNNNEKQNSSDGNNTESVETKADLDVESFKELAVDPCNLLTEDFVTSHFGIDSKEIEKDSYQGKSGKISSFSNCKYSWKKPNFEEIDKRNQERIMSAMLESAKKGDTKGSINAAMEMEKSHFFVEVTNLEVYENEEEAQKRFELLHKVPKKEDMEKLNDQIDQQDSLTNSNKEMGKDLAGGIVAHMKFEHVEGIGTNAYWDFMADRLDILYGTLQIGIGMHISEDHQKNVEEAKKVAQKIIEQF